MIADPTFATSYLLRPIAFGADIAVHAAAKLIGGHSALFGGVLEGQQSV